MIRLLVLLVLAGALAYCGSTVKLGNRTFFGHVRAIWATDEVRDLKQGVQEKAGPAAEKVKKGVSAGYKAMTEEEKKAEEKKAADAAAGDAAASDAAAGSSSGAGASGPRAPAPAPR